MILERVRDRALVPVVGREVVDDVELVLERGEHPVVGDRRLEQLHALVIRQILPFAREQVVDDEYAFGALREEERTRFDADEAGAADDELAAADHRPVGFDASSPFRCVYVSSTPYSR